MAQFGPALILLPAIAMEPRVRPLWKPLAVYALAKLAEGFDRSAYAFSGIAGHPVKHVLAALAAYWLLQWSYTCSDMEPLKPAVPQAATKIEP